MSQRSFEILVCIIGFFVIFQQTEAVMRAKVRFSNIPHQPPGPAMQSKDVMEVGCVSRKGIPDLNTSFINDVPSWYVPMASKFYYYHWAEILINRSMAGKELNSLCLKWLFMAPTHPRGSYNVVVGGFRLAVTQLCKDTGFETETCEAPKDSPEYHKGGHIYYSFVDINQADNVATIVATDNKKWLMMVRCVQQKYRDWAVYVADPKSIDHSWFKTIAMEVKSHGFDLKNAETAKYDQCAM